MYVPTLVHRVLTGPDTQLRDMMQGFMLAQVSAISSGSSKKYLGLPAPMPPAGVMARPAHESW